MGIWSRIFGKRKLKPTETSHARWAWLGRGHVKVTSDTAMQVSAFHRGVTYISTQIAKLPWEVKDKENKDMEGRVRDLLDLAPNTEMSSFMWRLVMVQAAIIHGNAYSEIERAGDGSPLALWPIPSRQVRPYRTPSGLFIYEVTNGQSGEKVYVPAYDMFHLRNFHTSDGLVGQGVAAYAVETLGIALAADQMASGIFHNGGLPSGILKHPGVMSDEAYKRLKDSWDEQSGGTKSGGTRILEEGVDYTPIKVENDVLQFLESRQFGVLEVARFLGVPPTKLFDTTAATYSNVENANLEVATDTLHAWARNLETEADIKLLNYRYGGRKTELDLYEVFRGDMTTRASYFKALMGCGAMTPNEIREREGDAGYDGGDEFYIATNNFTPVSRMNEVIDAEIAQKTRPAASPAPKPDPQQQALESAAIRFLEGRK